MPPAQLRYFPFYSVFNQHAAAHSHNVNLTKQTDTHVPPHRSRASFAFQSNALARKNWAFQKRRWGSNICLFSSPFVICLLLYLLEETINSQLNSRSFRCGCRCLSCCDWVPVRNYSTISYVYECYNATADRPCSPYASCSAYNDTYCGYLFSTADQVGFCEVKQPPLWPALVQIPRQAYRSAKYPEIDPGGIPPPPILPPDATNTMYTGQNMDVAAQLMNSMWSRAQTITDAAVNAYLRAQATGQQVPSSTENSTIASESDFIEAAGSLTRGLYEFGLVMGTSSFTSVSMLMEPAFVATSSGSVDGASSRPSLYFAQPNCTALSPQDLDTLSRIGEAITNMTGFPVECVSMQATPQSSLPLLNDQVYCGWLSSGCVVRNNTLYTPSKSQTVVSTHPIQEYPGSLYDWRGTDPINDRYDVSVWVNNSNVARDPGIPDFQRWAQPVNLAANAFVKQVGGANASARLAGIKDMPRVATQLRLDFSSLLGPLFMMWFFQMQLPINVYGLVHEKEHHLRIMMRMQGLREGVYYIVQYCWMVAMYCVFAGTFVAVGSGIGLKIFTLNNYGVQLLFYFLWGNAAAAFSFYFASWMKETRPAVLLAVIYVIITGFVANLVIVQYVEQGPAWVVDVAMLVPAFALFRGLYELAQYAFLADRTGGSGLTWSKLTDQECGMLQVWAYLAVMWMVFPMVAYYIEAVSGSGTGVKRHWLFFLGFKSSGSGSGGGGAKSEKAVKKQKEKQEEEESALAIASPTLDYYYGSSKSEAAGSPAFTLEHLSMSDPAHVTTPPHALSPLPSSFKSKLTSIARKITNSVHLTVPHHNALPLTKQRPISLDPDVSTAKNEEGADVAAERGRVDALWSQWSSRPSTRPPSAVILHELRKVYPSKDGNAPKVAVHDLSLAIDRCECFGLLGPNGAGKTTTIRMMEGFLDPSSGHAIIEGFSIPGDIDSIYSLMGACPQHDLLWAGLTGREHLLFYGRLKNLKGRVLRRAVDDGLRSVNLYDVGDNKVGSYSGGMKRRLSVAISLIGDPLVVYLDEPSTGLDPSSRHLLWEVIKNARKNKAVVLTTHSMEEAEALCDRLGIFVGGRLQCLGNPKDLTARFGGYLSFTITTPPHQEAVAAAAVKSMSQNARLVYALGGTQKYELPLTEVEVDGVFRRMEEIKLRREVDVLDWGVSNATLEEVFIKIARDAGVSMSAWAG